MIKIGLELTPAIEQRTGIGNISFLIAKNILDYFDEENFKFKFIYNFIKNKDRQKYLIYTKKNKNYVIRLPKRIYYNLYKFKIPINYFVGSLDILHITGLTNILSNKKTKVISTIHDIAFKIFSDFYDDKKVKELDQRIKFLKAQSDLIITSSYSTKYDLIKFYNIPENKIKVIYFSINENFKKEKKEEEINIFKRKNELPAKYFLFVGSYDKRKNLKNIIKAFNEFKKYDKKNYYLIIIGKSNLKIQNEIGVNKNVIFADYVEDKDLPYYYYFADALLYCSYYEGFGLPILEAFASNIPVLTTFNSSMKELGGESGIYIKDPDNVEEIKDKLIYLSKLKEEERVKIIESGKERLKKFDIEECIKKIKECYFELLNK